MAVKPFFKLHVGSWSINSAADPLTELVAIDTGRSLVSPGDACHITLYAPPIPQPSLLEQAAGAVASALGLGGGQQESFSVQIRGNLVKPGDPISIELTAGDAAVKVMTAAVESIDASLVHTKITGRTGMRALANTRLNQTYENQTLKQIVEDLAGQAGVATGQVERGSTYPYFVVHEARPLLDHVRDLALRDGLELYFDPDNKLTLQKFDKTSADHTFHYGIDILGLQLFRQQPARQQIRIYGESPASNQGSDTWSWLIKDLSPFRSEAGQGSQLLAIQDRAVRTKDAADQLAVARFGAVKDQASGGRLKILGNPTVRVADAIEIKSAPRPELNGLFKVLSVRHILNKKDGYLTFVTFSGQGGAAAAGDLLGAAGALAGAIGL